jgi:tryptophan synthase alpha chain
MSGKSSLEAAIRAARAQGRPARIPFITGGFPSKEAFWGHLSDLAGAGADIIEIGAPFSDPVADGPVVAAASLSAISEGATLRGLVAGLASLPPSPPLVLMSYANPLVQYGWELSSGETASRRLAGALEILAGDLAKTPVKGVIVPDAPFEELGPFHQAFSGRGLDLVPLVGLNTTLERMRLYKPIAGGYVYVVSVLGVTGVRGELPQEAAAAVARAREVFDLPVALGFGVSRPAQLSELGADPDAVIFGSALLRHISGGGGAKEFMAPWAAG